MKSQIIPFPLGLTVQCFLYKNCCRQPLNPAAALRCLPHSDVKSPKPPHWACSDKPVSGSVDRSLAVICTWRDEKWQEQWEAIEAEISGSERQSQQLLYYQTHTQKHLQAHRNIYSKQAKHGLAAAQKLFIIFPKPQARVSVSSLSLMLKRPKSAEESKSGLSVSVYDINTKHLNTDSTVCLYVVN